MKAAEGEGVFFSRQGRVLWLKWAICLLSWITMFCLVFYQSNTTPLLLLALAGVASFFLPGRCRPSALLWLFLLYITYSILVDIVFFPDTGGFGMYRKMLYAFFAGAAVFYALGDREVWFPVQLPYAAFVALVCGVGLAVFSGDPPDLFLQGRLRLLMNHPNGAAALFALCHLFCLAALLPGGQRGEREKESAVRCIPRFLCRKRFFAALMPVFLAALWMTLSRTSFFVALMLTVVLVCVAVYRYKGTRALLLALAAAGVVSAGAAAVGAANPESPAVRRMLSAVTAPAQDKTFRSRMPGWESAWHAFRQHPLIGNGPESFAITHAAWMNENRQRLIQEYGKSLVEGDTEKLPHAHNMYIMLLAENGLVGFVLFVSLCLYPLGVAVARKSLYGTLVPVLLFFLSIGMMEAPFYGSRAASLPITVLFMTLGYFACILGAPDFRRTPAAPEARKGAL